MTRLRRSACLRRWLLGTVALLVALACDTSASAEEPASVACPPGMLFVPGGPFLIGDADGFPDETPTSLTVRPFCLDATEVTVAAYAACAREGRCTPAHARPEWSTLRALESSRWSDLCNRDRPDRQDHPVNCVTWAEGDRYCKEYGLRLPTEAEWEYAARGGAEARKFPWGAAAATGELANLCGAECARAVSAIRGSWSPLYTEDDGWAATAPVSSFPKGDARWGHHDLTGNVCEWVTGNYCPYGDPGCADDGTRMTRGSHFITNSMKKARAARRNGDDRWHRSPDAGFRCATDAGVTERRAVGPVGRVTSLPELPSLPRLGILAAIGLLVGVGLGGFGGAASGVVVVALLYFAQLDLKTAIATGFVVVGVGHAVALATPALRRRVSMRAAGPISVAAFVAAFCVGALARFLPDRVQVAAVAIAVVAVAVQVAQQLRRPQSAGAGKPGGAARPLQIGGPGSAP